ncbi:MAG TPA: hypothetical protein VGR95_18960 [Thermoanaerobaculia bacterium]|nr:hypothetical protein [Thermoanaerobaculia bacterium]
MGELNITFQGVCTSIFGMIPGVPMRTVLPDALAVLFGQVVFPTGLNSSPRAVDYYLMPHIAIIRDKLVNGQHYWLRGSYLKVVNAKPQPLCWERGGYSLTQFKKNVGLSRSVALEGRAAAYFDILGGRVWHEGGSDDPVITRVSIKTDGPPILSITPLPGAIQQFTTEQVVQTSELYVTNLDVQASVEDTQFDFLWNYLVTEGGIPNELLERTPGMTRQANSVTFAHLGERMKALGTLIETSGTVHGWRNAQAGGDEPGPFLKMDAAGGDGSDLGTLAKFTIDPVAMDPSCSTSNLP